MRARAPRFDDLDRAIARDLEPLRYRRVTFYDGDTVVERDRYHSGKRAKAPEHAMVAHRSFESFLLAVAPPQVHCFFCPGFADAPDHAQGCPWFEPISPAEARAGLRGAYAAGGGNAREKRRAAEQPVLATDAEIRACTRTGAEQ